jgi:hypothetical protein
MTYTTNLIQSYNNDTCLQRFIITKKKVYSSYDAMAELVLNETLSSYDKRK